MTAEVTIRIVDGIVAEWDMHIGDPYESPPPPVMLFLAEDIHQALRHGTSEWPGRGTCEVNRDGYATCVIYGSGTAIYELFPARFNDARPYKPLVYVGRWPD